MMTASIKVCEQLSSTDLAADGIRPGGLELTERALAWCGFQAGSRIIDVGCGSGVTLDRLTRVHRLSALGVDASAALLAECSARNPALSVVRAAGEHLPVPDESADGIFAECSLSVMADPGQALSEFRRVLKAGGRLILTDVYARNPGGVERLAHMPLDCCVRGAIAREDLVRRLNRRDFSIDLWEDHSDLLARFAAHLIFSYGSLNRFWSRTASDTVDPEEIRQAVSEAKPGYFLAVTRKLPSSR